MRKPIVLCLVALLALTGCQSLNGRFDLSSAPQPPDPKTQMPSLEMRIALLVEEQRHRLDPKAKPLAIDPALSQVARARAADMAAKSYLAHTAPDGATSASQRW